MSSTGALSQADAGEEFGTSLFYKSIRFLRDKDIAYLDVMPTN